MVVADSITSRAAEQLADRLRSIVVSIREGETVGVGMSVGVAMIDGTRATALLIAEADAAMYRDKLRRR